MPDWRWSVNTWQYLKRLVISSGVNHKLPVGLGGIANSAQYLGSLGCCLKLALPVLFHTDSGLCALKIMQEISTRNPRSTAWRRASREWAHGFRCLLEQGQHALLRLVGLGQHGGGGLRDDLRLGQAGRLFGVVGVHDAAA